MNIMLFIRFKTHPLGTVRVYPIGPPLEAEDTPNRLKREHHSGGNSVSGIFHHYPRFCGANLIIARTSHREGAPCDSGLEFAAARTSLLGRRLCGREYGLATAGGTHPGGGLFYDETNSIDTRITSRKGAPRGEPKHIAAGASLLRERPCGDGLRRAVARSSHPEIGIRCDTANHIAARTSHREGVLSCDELRHIVARTSSLGGRLCYDGSKLAAAGGSPPGGGFCYDRKYPVTQSTQWSHTGILAGQSYGYTSVWLVLVYWIISCNLDCSYSRIDHVLCAYQKADKEYPSRHVMYLIFFKTMMDGAAISSTGLMRIKSINVYTASCARGCHRVLTRVGAWIFHVLANRGDLYPRVIGRPRFVDWKSTRWRVGDFWTPSPLHE